jgi:Ca2+-dependent lipid-binding protein
VPAVYKLAGSDATFIITNPETGVIDCKFKAWADQLRSTDSIGRPDPYFKVYRGDRELFKSEKGKGRTTVWKTSEFTVLDHVTELNIKVFDKDTVTPDDLLGSCKIHFSAKAGKTPEAEHNLGKTEKGEENGFFYVGQAIKPAKLSAWADKLCAKDKLTSTSDPFFEVFHGERRLFKSEKVDDTLTPVWKEAHFHVPVNCTELKINVYDHDTATLNDLIGFCVVPYPFKKANYPLWSIEEGYDTETQGEFIVGDEQVEVELKAWADELKKCDDPYYEVRFGERVLYKSPVSRTSVGEDTKKKAVTPVWQPATFKVPDTAKSVSVTVFDRDSLSRDDALGTVEVALPFINDTVYDLLNSKKEKLGVFIVGDAAKPCKLTASGEKLPIGDETSSDPYYEIWTGDGTRKLYEAKPVGESLTPLWFPANFFVPVNTEELLIKVLDHDDLSKNDLLGVCTLKYPLEDGVYPLTGGLVTDQGSNFIVGNNMVEYNIKAWADGLGKLKEQDMEPYYQIKHGDRELYRSEQAEGVTPIWFSGTFKAPGHIKKVTVVVSERDQFTADDLLGSCEIPLTVVSTDEDGNGVGAVADGAYKISDKEAYFVIGEPQKPDQLHAWAIGLEKCDAFYEVKSNGRLIYKSEKVENTTTPVWDMCDIQVPVNAESLDITIYDKDTFTRNDIVGMCIIAYPFKQNTAYSLGGTTGYFNVGFEEVDVKIKAWADDLTDVEFFGKIEPYYTVSYGDKQVYKSREKRGVMPIWEEAEFEVPKGVKELVVKVFDKESGKDELIGVAKVPFIEKPVEKPVEKTVGKTNDTKNEASPSETTFGVENGEYMLFKDGSDEMRGQFMIGDPWKETSIDVWAFGFEKGSDVRFKVFTKSDQNKMKENQEEAENLNDEVCMYKSETVKNSTAPVFKTAEFMAPVLDQKMFVRFYDDKTVGEDELLEEVEVEYKDLSFVKGKHVITNDLTVVIGNETREIVLKPWADGLEDTDMFGEIEPYFKVCLGDRVFFKSPSVIPGTTPVWPTVTVDFSKYFDEFEVKVFEKDAGSSDDLLGSCKIPIPAIEPSKIEENEVKPAVVENAEDAKKAVNAEKTENTETPQTPEIPPVIIPDNLYPLDTGIGTFVIGDSQRESKLVAWAQNLPAKTSDPYFKVLTNDLARTVIYKSENSKNSSTPIWKETQFQVPVNTKNVVIQLCDDTFGKDVVFGETVIPFPFENGEYGVWNKGEDVKFMIGDDRRKVKALCWVDNLKDTDLFGKIEPYFKVRYGDRVMYTSSTLPKGKGLPVWREAVFEIPKAAKSVIFEVYDQDHGKDDLIGSCTVDTPELESEAFTDSCNNLDGNGFLNIGPAAKPTKIMCLAEGIEKANSYFQIYTHGDKSSDDRELYKSEDVADTTAPEWLPAEFLIPVNQEKIVVFVMNKNVGSDEQMARVEIPVPIENGLYELSTGGMFIIGNDRKEVKLQAWADGLKDTELFGKPDPYFKVFRGDQVVIESEVAGRDWDGGAAWRELTFEVFEYVKELKIQVFNKNKVSDDLLGECVVEMTGDWMTNGNANALGDSGASFYVGEANQPMELECWANGLSNKGSSPDPKFKIFAGEREIYDSKTVKKTGTPIWPKTMPFYVPKSATSVTVKIYDDDKLSRDDLIGEVAVPVPFKNGIYDVLNGEGQFIIGQNYEPVELQCWADSIQNQDTFGENECYYEIKFGDMTIHTSEPAKSGKYPVWPKAEIHVPDVAKELTVFLYDQNLGKDTLISEFKIPFPIVEKQYELENQENGIFIIGPPQLPSTCRASAEGLPDMPDSYYEVFTVSEEEVSLYKSETSKNLGFPEWDEKVFRIPVNETQVLVKIMNSKLGADECLGQVVIPLNSPLMPGVYDLDIESHIRKFVVSKPARVIEIESWADQMRKTDFTGKGDPYFLVKFGDRVLHTSQKSEGQTPVWKREKFGVLEHMEELVFEFFDSDTGRKDDFLGSCKVEVTKTEIVPEATETPESTEATKIPAEAESKPVEYEFTLSEKEYDLGIDEETGTKNGLFYIGKPAKRCILEAWADKLEAKDKLTDSSDPFFVVSVKDRELYKSKVIDKTCTPVWEEAKFHVPVNTKEVKIEVFDKDSGSGNDLIGCCYVPYPFQKGEYGLWNPDKGYQSSHEGVFIIGNEKIDVELKTWADELVGCDDPYFTVKMNDLLLYTSTVSKSSVGADTKKKSVTPVWPTANFKIPDTLKFVDFEVFDKKLGTDDCIGKFRVGVEKGVFEEGAFPIRMPKDLLNDTKGVFMIGEPAKPIELFASAEKLPGKDAKNIDPYYQVFVEDENNDLRKLFESNKVDDSRTPTWDRAEIFIPVNTEEVIIKVFDKDALSSDDELGDCKIKLELDPETGNFKFPEGVFKLKGGATVETDDASFMIGNSKTTHVIKAWADGLAKLKSDVQPYFKVFYGDKEIYQSEAAEGITPIWLRNEFRAPSWAKEVRVVISDEDTFSSDNLLGECVVPLPLVDKVYPLGEEAKFILGEPAKPAKLKAWAEGLPGKDGTSDSATSDPYFELRDGDRVVYKSEVVEKTLTPIWEEAEVKVPVNCTQLTACVFDQDSLGKNDVLGLCMVDYPFVDGKSYPLGGSLGSFNIGFEETFVSLKAWSEDLNNADSLGTMEPYYIVYHGDRQIYRSQPSKAKIPIWEEAEFRVPDAVKEITVKIFEKDSVKDDLIGVCTLPVDMSKALSKTEKPIANAEYPIGIPGEDCRKGIFIVGDPWKDVELSAWYDGLKGDETIDPYFEVWSKKTNKKIKTSNRVDNKRTGIWDNLKFQVPADESELNILIFHDNKIGKDDDLGSVTIPYPLKNGAYQLDTKGHFIVGHDKTEFVLKAWADGLESSDTFGEIQAYYKLFCGDLELFKSDYTMPGTCPVWLDTTVKVPKHLEGQEVTITVYDYDGPMNKDDVIGDTRIKVPVEGQEPVEGKYQLGWKDNESKGFFMIGEPAKPTELQAWGNLLPNGDNYYKIYAGQILCYESEPVKDSGTPKWSMSERFKVPVNTENVMIKIYEEKVGRDEEIGQTSIPFPFVDGVYNLFKDNKIQKSAFVVGYSEKEFEFKAWADNLSEKKTFGSIKPRFVIKYGDMLVMKSLPDNSGGDIPVWEAVTIKLPSIAEEISVEILDGEKLLGKCMLQVPTDDQTSKWPKSVNALFDAENSEVGSNFITGEPELPAKIFCSAEIADAADSNGKADPYYEIWTRESGELESKVPAKRLYKSEVQKKVLYPIFGEAEFRCPVNTTELEIKVFDEDLGKDTLIGDCIVEYPFKNAVHEITDHSKFVIGDAAQEVVLEAWADQLKKTDMSGHSDPYFIVKYGDRELYKSEVAKIGITPVWKKCTFTVPSHIDTLDVFVFDKDTGSDEVLGEVVQKIKLPLVDAEYTLGELCGKFYVGKAEEPAEMDFWATGLTGNKDASCDPLFKIYAGERELYKSEKIDNSCSPEWKKAKFHVPKNTDSLDIKVFHEKLVGDELIGKTIIPFPFDKKRYDFFGEHRGQFVVGNDKIKIEGLQSWADNLTNDNLLGKLKPYYTLKYNDLELYKSEVSSTSIGEDTKAKSQTPVFQPATFEVPSDVKFIRIDLWDDEMGKDTNLGYAMIEIQGHEESENVEVWDRSKMQVGAEEPIVSSLEVKTKVFTIADQVFSIGEKGASWVTGEAAKPSEIFCSAENLKKLAKFGENDCYFEIHSVGESNRVIYSHKDKVKGCTPVWDKSNFHVPVNTEKCLIKVMHDATGSDSLLGEIEVDFPFVNGVYELEKGGSRGFGQFIIGDERLKLELECWADSLNVSKKGDPFYQVKIGDRILYESEQAEGKTPVWKKAVLEIPSHLKQVDIVISNSNTFSSDDILGQCTIPIPDSKSETFNNKFVECTHPLTGKTESENLVSGEVFGSFVIGRPAAPVKAKMWAEGLENKDGTQADGRKTGTDKSDTYFVIKADGVELYKSEVQKDHLTPVWGEIEFHMPLNHDFVTIELYDDDFGDDAFVGMCRVDYGIYDGMYDGEKGLKPGRHMLSGTLGTFNVGDEMVETKLEAWMSKPAELKPKDKVYYEVFYGDDRSLGKSEVSKDEAEPIFKEIIFDCPKFAVDAKKKLKIVCYEEKTIGKDILGMVEINVDENTRVVETAPENAQLIASENAHEVPMLESNETVSAIQPIPSLSETYYTLNNGAYLLDDTDQAKGTFKVGKAVNYIKIDAWADKMPDEEDYYYQVFAGDKEIYKSDASDKSTTPVWEESIDIKVPVNTSMLEFKVFEKKTIGSDVYIGKFDVEFKQNEPFFEKGKYSINNDEATGSPENVADFYIGGEKN